MNRKSENSLGKQQAISDITLIGIILYLDWAQRGFCMCIHGNYIRAAELFPTQVPGSDAFYQYIIVLLQNQWLATGSFQGTLEPIYLSALRN